MSSLCLFVCQRDYAKTTQRLSRNWTEGWYTGQEKRLDFGGNRDHVTLGLELG